MPKFDVSRSLTINASAEKVFSILSDFHQWRVWSPWLVTEPEATMTIAADGQSYSWEGSRVGEGSMAKNSETSLTELYFDLTFIKPWKSQAKVEFHLKPQGESVEVTWVMHSALPFFMFFMKKMMVALIGMDYDRGLSMLKDYAETGEVQSKLEFAGDVDYPGCRYVGIHTTCAIREVGPTMEADFERLNGYVQSGSVEASGIPFSIYSKWDMVGGQTEYTIGYPVCTLPTDLPEGLMTGEIPQTQAYCITHRGPYRHLGNAWSAGMMMARSKVFKQRKDVYPFETYPTMPGEGDEKDIETRIHFPVV